MGYPLHGNDLCLDITPVQAGAGWAVGWDKPQFWGREALAAERAAKQSRLMRGLVVTGRGIPRSHCAVKDATGAVVGEVTSGTFSPTLKQGIALALLDRSVTLGDDVVVDVRGRDVAATVSSRRSSRSGCARSERAVDLGLRGPGRRPDGGAGPGRDGVPDPVRRRVVVR